MVSLKYLSTGKYGYQQVMIRVHGRLPPSSRQYEKVTSPPSFGHLISKRLYPSISVSSSEYGVIPIAVIALRRVYNALRIVNRLSERLRLNVKIKSQSFLTE
jgi:hypothetical protein